MKRCARRAGGYSGASVAGPKCVRAFPRRSGTSAFALVFIEGQFPLAHGLQVRAVNKKSFIPTLQRGNIYRPMRPVGDIRPPHCADFYMMKTYNNLWHELVSFENLYASYRKAAKCKYYRQEVLKFSENLEENLIEIQNELIWSMYKPSSPRLFYVYEPKLRLISAPVFRDRIVHHALCSVIEPLIDKKLIYDTYACRVGKGTVAAVQRVQHFTRLAKRNYGSYYVFKGDIHSFFPSINHDILKAQIRRTISDKRVLWLIDTIIDSAGEVGLPIGALTSQLFANLLLGSLDHYIKEELRIRYYVRYMDDLVLVLRSKSEAREAEAAINNYIVQKLGLAMNGKSQVISGRQGIPFCGFRIWPTHICPTKPTLRRGKRRLRKLAYLYNRGELELATFRASLMSFLGHYKYCNSNRSVESVLKTIVLTGERK